MVLIMDKDESFAKIEIESFKRHNRDWRDGMSASHIVAKVISHAAKLITEGDLDKDDCIPHWHKILWYNMAWNELRATGKLLDDRPTDGGNGGK